MTDSTSLHSAAMEHRRAWLPPPRPGPSLPARVGFILGAIGVAFVLLSSVPFFFRAQQLKLEEADQQLRQLAATVEQAAAIAAYLDDDQLAREVIDGLVLHQIVAGAAIESLTGMLKSGGEPVSEPRGQVRHYALKSPFPPVEPIGQLIINSDLGVIHQQAFESALGQAFILSIYTIIVIGVGISLTHVLLSRPIRAITRQFHTIEPGGIQRLQRPRWHQDSEIGELVDDCNRLLDSFSASLASERALRARVELLEQRFRMIFVCANSGIAVIDPSGRILQYNPAFKRIVAAPALEVSHQDGGPLFCECFADPGEVMKTLRQAPFSRSPLSRDFQLVQTGGDLGRYVHCLFSAITDESGESKTPLIEALIYDVSDRTHRERRSRLEAEHDSLTGLYNRRAGERHIRRIFEQAVRDGGRFALLILDLDHFKPINDTYGHEAGDRVLVEVSRRLKTTVRDEDILARWGGDEFLLLIRREHAIEDITGIANRILEHLSAPIDLGNGKQGSIGSSIGIAVFPDHGIELERLIDLADRAMYQVKQQGRDGYRVGVRPPTEISAPVSQESHRAG